jgi:hypothetical protein
MRVQKIAAAAERAKAVKAEKERAGAAEKKATVKGPAPAQGERSDAVEKRTGQQKGQPVTKRPVVVVRKTRRPGR